jgi:hypothetical protein
MVTQFEQNQSRLPSGFSFADEHQLTQFEERGVVNGASKVCLVNGSLAVRLHPPRKFHTLARRRPLIAQGARDQGLENGDALAWYLREYNAGFAAGKRGHSAKWQNGGGTHAWDDGFLDARAERPKWHLAHCVNHDTCGLG